MAFVTGEPLKKGKRSTDVKFILGCDESGAKGYANQTEKSPGEVGVFAGLLVPEAILKLAEKSLETVIAPFRTTDGKLHITDLPPADQAALRTGLFDVIREHQLPCFWYAIHVEGFHAHHLKMVELLQNAANEAAKLGGAVKPRASREAPASLHVELFRALYAHMVAFIEERSPGEVEIEARIDRVDTPIAKSFRQEADRLLETSRKSVVTGFDRVAQQVVRGEIRFETHYPPELQIETEVKSLELKIVGDEDPIVIAADVLSNSLAYHFHRRGPGELYEELNRPAAVATHPLARNLDTFWNWGEGDLVGDSMFRHPKAKPVAD